MPDSFAIGYITTSQDRGDILAQIGFGHSTWSGTFVRKLRL